MWIEAISWGLLAVPVMAGSYYAGWLKGRASLPEPTLEQVAEYMSAVVETEDYDARIRRNEAMLKMTGRRSMPRGNPGPPARTSRMQIRQDGRSTR